MARNTRSMKKSSSKTSNANIFHDENQQPITSPPKKKMTKQEKAEAKERARASMMPIKSPPNVNKAKNSPTKNVPKQKQVATPDIELSEKLQAIKIENEEKVKDEKTKTKGDAKVPIKSNENIKKKVETIPTVPQLDGFAKLLLVDLQHDNAKEVKLAIGNLWSAFDTSKPVPFSLEPSIKEQDILGAASFLVLAMYKWKGDLGIQHGTCRCLAAYATYSRYGRVALIKSGAIQAITIAMLDFPFNEWMQKIGCLALLHLSYPGMYDPMGIKDVREAWNTFVFNFNGIPLICNAIQVLEDVPDSLVHCAELLLNLVGIGSLSVEDIKSGVFKHKPNILLYDATQKHHKHYRLSKEGGQFAALFNNPEKE